MNVKLKHRLVGASVLLALAVLILPDLLDGEKVKREQSFAVIPLQPQIESDEFKKPQAPEPLARVEQAFKEEPLPEQAVSVTLDSKEAANPSDRQLSQFKSSGWVLQLGVFRNAANVNELIEKIRQAGYPAFSKPKAAVQGEPTWVYVGPNLNKEKLLGEKQNLKALTGLNGKIYPYNPQSQ